MKRITFLIVLIVFIVGCKNEINITPPTILTQNLSVSVFDTLSVRVEEFADIDGVRINADYYNWVIVNSEGVAIKDDFPDSSVINWMPQEAGYYLIKVNIGYDSNKSITAIKEISITESPASLQKKIVGHWKGKGIRGSDNVNWGIELFIEDNKHYYGIADFSGSNPYCERGVFYAGRIDYYHWEKITGSWLWDSCGIPGNILNQRFDINQVNGNKGSGIISIGSVQIYDDGRIDTSSYDIPFVNLIIDNKNLHFEYIENNNPPTKIDLLKY
jgi:hypothetical protein